MKFEQAFKDIEKPQDIDQNILHEYLCELYSDPSFVAKDASYIDDSSSEAVAAYKERVNLLIDKLIELSENQKFAQLKAKFSQDVLAGETRKTLDDVKKTAEAICYKLSKREISAPEKFKAEIKSATLDACEAGLLTNMQNILYSMSDSLYENKYDYIQNLATEYVRDNKLASSSGNEVHIANELIHEVSKAYKVIPPRDIHARYRDLSINAPEYFAKHAAFKEYLNNHFGSREGIYSFVEYVTNNHLSKLPDAEPNKKFSVKAEGANNDSEDLDQVNILADSLNIPVTAIIQYSDDGQEFEYQTNYISVIKAAIMHSLMEQSLVQHDPLTIQRTKTTRTYAAPRVIREPGKDPRVIRDTAGTEKIIVAQQAIIESPDGWFLAEKIGDRIAPGKKLLDTRQLQGLTIEGQNIEDYLHIELSASLKSGINFEDSLRALIEKNENNIGLDQPDITKELFFLSDQRMNLKLVLSEEELISISMIDIENWNNFKKLLEEDSPDILPYIARYGSEIMLNKYLEISGKTNEDIRNWRDKEKRTLIHIATSNNNKVIVERLILAGVDINAENKDGYTALYLTAFHGETETVVKLVELGADKEAKDIFGYTALHRAAEYGKTETVVRLVELGADINSKDKDGYTALHSASWRGETKTVAKLVELGAGINAVNKDGYTALHTAAEGGQTETVVKLVELGADINAVNKDGYTALHRASQYSKTETVVKLVELGVDINDVNKDGNTALHLAAVRQKFKTVVKLVELGADINAKNKDGNTTLHLAAEQGRTETVTKLVKLGVDINDVNKDGNTALHLAAVKQKFKTVAKLVELGADINAKNKDGQTALDVSAKKGSIKEVAGVLIQNKTNEQTSDLINNIINQVSGYIQDSSSGWKLVEDMVSQLPSKSRVEIVSAALEAIDNTSRRDRLLAFLPEEERNITSAKVAPTSWQKLRETTELMHGNSSVDVPDRSIESKDLKKGSSWAEFILVSRRNDPNGPPR